MKDLNTQSMHHKTGLLSKLMSYHLKMLNVKRWPVQTICTSFIHQARQVLPKVLCVIKAEQQLLLNGPWNILWESTLEMYTLPQVISDGLSGIVSLFMDLCWEVPLLCCIKENQPFQIQALCGPSSKSIRSTVFILVQQVSEPLEDRTMKVTGSESTTLQVSIIFLWPDKDAISLHTNGSEKMLVNNWRNNCRT